MSRKSSKSSKPNLSYEAADEDFYTEALPENTIFEEMFIRRPVIKQLGIVKVDPDEYAKSYAHELVNTNKLPAFINKIPPPDGCQLAFNWPRQDLVELEGDADSLKYVDLDKEGFGEYKDYLSSRGVHYIPNY